MGTLHHTFQIYLLFHITVCVGVMNKLISKLGSDEKQSTDIIENRFREFCLEAKKAENRFVSIRFESYFIFSFFLLFYLYYE